MSTEDLLRRIKPTANHLYLSQEMLEQDDPVKDLEVNIETDCEIIDSQLSLSTLTQLIEDTHKKFKPSDSKMDQFMAIKLHKALPITRRQASDKRIWHFLGLVKYPSFICHRWSKRPSKTGTPRRSEERFLGDRQRNTFARLWWACELTKENNDYSLTEALLKSGGFQDNYEAFFGRSFSAYQPALKAFIRVMSNKPESVVRQTAKNFGHVLTTLLLESYNTEQLESLIKEIASN